MGSELRGEPSDPSPSTSNRRQSNTTQNDALEYLKAVKHEFRDNPVSYENFLQIMKAFKSETYSTEEVVRRVKELFRWYPDLILGFNQFLPPNFKITLPKESAVDFPQAMSYVTKIKERFADETYKYTAFLNILHSYKKAERPTHDVLHEVQQLFRNHQDLIEEFYQFLPAGTTRLAGSNVRPDSSSNPIKIERGNNSNAQADMDGNNHNHNHNNNINKNNNNINNNINININIKSEERESEPHRSQSTPDPDSSPHDFNDAEGEQIREFLEKAKDRLETDAYEDMLKCVFSYSEGAIIADDVNMLVPDILADHPDLLAEFNQLVSHRENLVNASVKIESNSNNNEEEEGEGEKEEEEEEEEREREARRERRRKKSKSPPILSKEKYSMCKPVSELDLSNCQQCTPSYRLLPKNHVMPPSTNRSELEKSVLNDKWVSVTSGSEDYSFKHMRKNQYEESLFRCEDDRFEMDMLVETTKSTIERVERLMKRVQRGKVNANENFQDFFTQMNIRCIEKLYGDHGLDVMEVIKRNADVALPVVLSRLRQKLEEWLKCRNDFNKIWAEVYAKNYHKSLDHRSFIFKQEDMKNLSSKVLQAEIKEKHDKNLNDDTLLIAIGASPRNSGLRPDLEFQFPDSEIREDIYQILNFSCKEVFQSADQVRRAMRVYTNFMEPFLGAVDRVREVGEGGKARIVSVGGSGATTAVDESSGTGSPGGADVAGVGGSPPKPGATIESVKKELSRQEEEEREEGEISPEREGDNMEVENSTSTEPSRSNQNENGEEMEEGENEEEEGEIEHQEKVESEGEAETEEFTDSPLSDGGTNIRTVRPLAKRCSSVPTRSVRKENCSERERVFYADGPFYVLFRLYQVLYERILSAKRNSKEVASKGSNPGDLYARFKSALYSVLDGSSESGKYEDECRAAVGGTESYLLFTLDQLICKFCKHLQTIEIEETSKKLLELYKYERSRGPGRMNDGAYYDNALVLLHDEPIYRLAFGEKAGKLSIKLMDQVHKSPELTAVAIDPNFGDYLFNDYLSNKSQEKEVQGVFLKRNKRKLECEDENSPDCKALNGIRVSNGLECKMTCTKSKIAYVLDTEDYFYRERKRTKINPDQIAKSCIFKSHKFRHLVSRRLDQMK
ncbi:hypothetical protein LUZ60_009824 [Juncus effusus]|nr:hypothetical protein LUZ60_009824 [Juncus effusus]